MSNFFKKVEHFNQVVLGIEQRPIALLSNKELEYAIKAASEEVCEFNEAHTKQDLIAAVDAGIDLMYFTVGFLIRMGLTADQIDQCATAVHEANMAKKAGVQHKRAGAGVIDAVKGDGWVGPEIEICRILGG